MSKDPAEPLPVNQFDSKKRESVLVYSTDQPGMEDWTLVPTEVRNAVGYLNFALQMECFGEYPTGIGIEFIHGDLTQFKLTVRVPQDDPVEAENLGLGQLSDADRYRFEMLENHVLGGFDFGGDGSEVDHGDRARGLGLDAGHEIFVARGKRSNERLLVGDLDISTPKGRRDFLRLLADDLVPRGDAALEDGDVQRECEYHECTCSGSDLS